MALALLRRQPLFENLTDEELRRLYDMADTIELQPGTWLLRQGEPGDTMYVVLDGELEVVRREGAVDEVVAVRGRGDVIGEMALLQRQTRSASVRAITTSQLLVVGNDVYEHVLASNPETSRSILTTVMQRLRSTESMLMQREKLAALGTMAAGLAHELNNPAAAIARSAASLEGAFQRAERAASRLASAAPETDLLTIDTRPEPPSEGGAPLDALARADREDELQGWLDVHAPGAGDDAAGVLAEAGWTAAQLERAGARFAPDALPAWAAWVVASTEVGQLLDELRIASAAISRIVTSVKGYAYLDRDAVQMVDVNRSLEDTLVMLKHRLRSGVTVERDLHDLPLIEAHGGELNQVWTNLIDNAVDAMEGQGRLCVRSRRADDQVVVEIADTGPGIPEDVLPRLFEPFYTTKGVGAGTGLGLHIVHNIVVHRHGGAIAVRPRAGETCFQVRLPLRLPRRP